MSSAALAALQAAFPTVPQPTLQKALQATGGHVGQAKIQILSEGHLEGEPDSSGGGASSPPGSARGKSGSKVYEVGDGEEDGGAQHSNHCGHHLQMIT